MSLRSIKSTGIPKTGNLIDVGREDPPLVDQLLDQAFDHVTVLEISAAAFELAKARKGGAHTGWAIGRPFKLGESVKQLHHTPRGNKQPFIYCRFIRRTP